MQHIKHTRSDFYDRVSGKYGDLKSPVSLWRYDPVSCIDQYGHIVDWIMGQVTCMEELFSDASNFNENISRWNVGRVKSMKSTFAGASNFNQDIGQWNVGQVEKMELIFIVLPASTKTLGSGMSGR